MIRAIAERSCERSIAFAVPGFYLCWKTYVGRPETDALRSAAMGQLGNGLINAGHYEDALTAKEAELSMLRRIGADEEDILVAQGNLANSYQMLGREEQALQVRQEVYSGRLKLLGETHSLTISAACNYAISLKDRSRHEEAKSLMAETIPMAQRILGEGHRLALQMRRTHAAALYENPGASPDDLREAVTTLEEIERIARRVFGAAHPTTRSIELHLQDARPALRAREETPSGEA